jgi:hypothetical protein
MRNPQALKELHDRKTPCLSIVNRLERDGFIDKLYGKR